MKLYKVTGYYGSQHTETTVFCAETRNGTWYVCEGSVNVNMTDEEIDEGVDVEELTDIDMFTAGTPINSLDELETAINS